MPVADLLAVLLVTIVGRLRRRGEAPLSHVMFLLAGGMALIFFVYLFHLRPDLVYGYVLNTAWGRAGENRLAELLLVWLAVSMPILVIRLGMPPTTTRPSGGFGLVVLSSVSGFTMYGD